MTKYNIFVVEDDSVIAEQIKRHLEKWGYRVTCASNFQNVVAEFAELKPELVLMDIGLPFYNGYYWCSQIRQVSQVPIIFVSSAADNMNIVMAVNMGGDDFVVKPFEPEVLAAKVQAILRRTYTFRGQTNVMEYGGAVLNLSDATLQVNEQKVELTKNEFRMLQLLFENGGENATVDEKGKLEEKYRAWKENTPGLPHRDEILKLVRNHEHYKAAIRDFLTKFENAVKANPSDICSDEEKRIIRQREQACKSVKAKIGKDYPFQEIQTAPMNYRHGTGQTIISDILKGMVRDDA